MSMENLARSVKEASRRLVGIGTDLKNKALLQIADALGEHAAQVIAANIEDLERSAKEGLPAPLMKRLKFDERKIFDAIDSIHSVVKLEDPVGKTLFSMQLDDGLELFRVTCPIGVIELFLNPVLTHFCRYPPFA